MRILKRQEPVRSFFNSAYSMLSTSACKLASCKAASSLGASFGVAVSAAVFTTLSADGAAPGWIEGVITYLGRQDNLAVREAALFALGVNLLMVVAAIISIVLTVPKGKLSRQ